MKLGDGVEQAIHSVAMLASLQPGGVLPAAALAGFHGVSPSYLLKHLQALSVAGVLESVPGPTGGYRLARPPERISLLDIVQAVEGAGPAFRCSEIRQRGPNPLAKKPTRPCEINAAMLKAELAWKQELARVSVADLGERVEANDADGAIKARQCGFLQEHERLPKPK